MKIPVLVWETFLWLINQRVQKSTKTTKAISITLGCLPELEDKALLLNTPWTQDLEEPTWNWSGSLLPETSSSSSSRYASCQGRKANNRPNSTAAWWKGKEADLWCHLAKRELACQERSALSSDLVSWTRAITFIHQHSKYGTKGEWGTFTESHKGRDCSLALLTQNSTQFHNQTLSVCTNMWLSTSFQYLPVFSKCA